MICTVQVQPRKLRPRSCRLCMTPIRQHELDHTDHTDQESTVSVPKDLDHQVEIGDLLAPICRINTSVVDGSGSLNLPHLSLCGNQVIHGPRNDFTGWAQPHDECIDTSRIDLRQNGPTSCWHLVQHFLSTFAVNILLCAKGVASISFWCVPGRYSTGQKTVGRVDTSPCTVRLVAPWRADTMILYRKPGKYSTVYRFMASRSASLEFRHGRPQQSG